MVEISSLESKYSRLLEILRGYGSCALAFSAGEDSSLLLKAGVEALGVRAIIPVTAVSPIRRAGERKLASALAESLGARLELVYTKEYLDPGFTGFGQERCFICKAALYEGLGKIARDRGLEALIDGTNVDDAAEERQVFAVARRYGIKWPLVEAGLTTGDVEGLLEIKGLSEYIRPHYSCSADEFLMDGRLDDLSG